MIPKYDLHSTSQNSTAKEKIKFSERFGYGLGDVAVNLSWASVGMFIVYFYTDVIGLSASIIGTIILFSRFLDGVSDVLMGMAVDKTNSKHGKARPWLLWMSVPFAVFTVMLFMVPDVSNFWQIIYVIVSYNVFVLFFTMVVIPYGTLNSLITQNQHEREVLNLFRMFLAQIGVLIVANLTIPLVGTFGGGQTGWVITYAIMGVLAVVIFTVTFKTSKERVKSVKKPSNKVPLKESLKTLPKNKYWIIVFFYFIVYSIGYALN
uniref:MFS transporter n=1 Tax=Oceanobacillus damuensis TaxID=937928 RepID=UPI000A43F74D